MQKLFATQFWRVIVNDGCSSCSSRLLGELSVLPHARSQEHSEYLDSRMSSCEALIKSSGKRPKSVVGSLLLLISCSTLCK